MVRHPRQAGFVGWSGQVSKISQRQDQQSSLRCCFRRKSFWFCFATIIVCRLEEYISSIFCLISGCVWQDVLIIRVWSSCDLQTLSFELRAKLWPFEDLTCQPTLAYQFISLCYAWKDGWFSLFPSLSSGFGFSTECYCTTDLVHLFDSGL